MTGTSPITAEPRSSSSDPVAREAALFEHWEDARGFVVVGTLCTIAGGVVAAVSRPLTLELGPWTAGFLVLVGGVAQIGLGVGQAWLSALRPSPSLLRAELITWNVAVVLTIVGTLAAVPPLTSVAGIVLAVALVFFLVATRSASAAPMVWRVIYRGLAAIVLISIPIGLTLAWLRHR